MTGRPFFVLTRGSEYASVFLDGQYFGELATMRNLVATQIHEIRHLSGPDAVSRYGMRYGSGAVDVRSK